MVVLSIAEANEFEETAKSGDLAVVHFYADWAAQCGHMNEVLEELARQSELNKVKFAKCLAEDFPEISLKYNVSAVPTFLLLRSGTLLDRVNGANAAELTQKINEQLSKPAPKADPVPAKTSAESLNERLKKLTNAAPVMLFMKGTAQEPRCKFSRSIIDLLNSYKADYKTFDILNDEEVRQSLKTFSNWPTYPQLYVNGELIGGLDIVREMHESGDLKTTLPTKTESLEDRLKTLTNKAPCMIFMKGNPQEPRCGFSRQLMDIMQEVKVPFDSFDILTDEEVRQGLKTYSNWPTYPQVYVKGELVGGLDIIKELKASGDLLETLNGSA